LQSLQHWQLIQVHFFQRHQKKTTNRRGVV
jgi:hypothetical protein